MAFFMVMLSIAYYYASRKDQLHDDQEKTSLTTPTTPTPKRIATTETKDIEDLGKSLIPRTIKAMKKKKWKALTAAEKLGKRRELREKKLYTPFAAKLHKNKIKLTRTPATVLQLNIGLYCNQACSHCHVDSTPRRKEMMSRDTADHCLRVLKNSPSVKVLDLTGGAPELNREFKHLVKGARALGVEVIDRCNLTVLLEPHQEDLPKFLRDNQVHIIASLPCYLEDNVDKQRGDAVFVRSIEGLKRLNKLGYGKGNNDLRLDLVYNPTGVHLPPPASKLESAYKKNLMEKYGISFDKLICITNMPINRFYDHLKSEGKLEEYMNILVNAFNPSTCKGLMCRDYVNVSWDGRIYDCDFNAQLEMPTKSEGKDLNIADHQISGRYFK